MDPLIRVTDTSFPVPPINPNFDHAILPSYMGEYPAVAAAVDNFYYAWGDNRKTLITLDFPGGWPDPDVFSDTAEVERATGLRRSTPLTDGSFELRPAGKGANLTGMALQAQT